MRVMFFMPSLAGGGAERVTLDLCDGLHAAGVDVRLALASTEGSLSDGFDPPYPVLDLASRTLAVRALADLVEREHPDVLIGVLSHASVVAWLARAVARSSAHLVVMQHNTMSVSLGASRSWRDRALPLLCAVAYRRADLVCAVSDGVAHDLEDTLRMRRGRVQVVPNPIDYQRIEALATDPLPDVLPPGDGPLVVAAGRLVPQKDFATLLTALSRTESRARLVVVGEGPLRAELEQQVSRLGLQDRVRLPGFVANPYPLFAAADVIALSSRWEGLPTVLLEALAFRAPVVATDCPSGPREILQAGRLGRLVSVGSPHELGRAIDAALAGATPLDHEQARQRYRKPVVVADFVALLRRLVVQDLDRDSSVRA